MKQAGQTPISKLVKTFKFKRESLFRRKGNHKYKRKVNSLKRTTLRFQ